MSGIHRYRAAVPVTLGNVRDRSFGDIWTDETNPLVARLREREGHLTGRYASCQYRSICRGGSRLLALATSDDPCAPDPQCQFSEAERDPDGELSEQPADRFAMA